MKKTFLHLVLACGAIGLSQAATVSFSQADYNAVVNQPVALHVVITYAPSDPGNELFSFGVRIIPDPGTSLAADSIEPAPDLDFFGVGGSAQVDADPAVLGIKGNVEDFQSPHTDSHLATYELRFSQTGSHNLGLALYNTLGPSEQIFVDGDGDVLDPLLTFGSATVHVIPEPPLLPFLSAAFLAGLARRRRHPNP